MSKDTIYRQDAIDAIHEVMLGLFDFTDDNIEEPMTYTEVKFLHINKVIAEKIKALPSAQPELCKTDMPEQGDPAKSGPKTDETCTDCISRQAAIDVLEERLQANGYSNVALVSELNRSIGYLMQLPSTQPEIANYSTKPANDSGELISKAAALALAKDIYVPCKDGTAYRHRCIDPQELMELPAAQPETELADLKAKFDMLNGHCEILDAENKQLRRTIVYMAVKHMKAEAGE